MDTMKQRDFNDLEPLDTQRQLGDAQREIRRLKDVNTDQADRIRKLEKALNDCHETAESILAGLTSKMNAEDTRFINRRCRGIKQIAFEAVEGFPAEESDDWLESK
jgi:hypothetical protein